jgi:hypothetical protein
MASLFCTTVLTGLHAQHGSGADGLPYHKIYAYGMDANIRPALNILEVHPLSGAKDEDFKQRFMTRFGGELDKGEYAPTGDEQLDELLGYFRDYWRVSLLDNDGKYFDYLGKKVMPFLMQHYPPFTGPELRDSIGVYLADYIRSRGFYTTEEVNPTGRLVDMLIWKKETDSTYQVSLSKSEQIEVKVVMMEDFVTLGWMEYATLGEHHPGGWTTESAVYCVKNAYDLDSERFTVSYLAHEARHFSDKKKFEDLSGKDLEYRAKLTELHLAQQSTYELISFFIQNANAHSHNAHPLANYQLIQDLSGVFFEAYESDMDKWQTIKQKKISKAAAKLLKEHSVQLKSKG